MTIENYLDSFEKEIKKEHANNWLHSYYGA